MASIGKRFGSVGEVGAGLARRGGYQKQSLAPLRAGEDDSGRLNLQFRGRAKVVRHWD